jgi:hypothetical protein
MRQQESFHFEDNITEKTACESKRDHPDHEIKAHDQGEEHARIDICQDHESTTERLSKSRRLLRKSFNS